MARAFERDGVPLETLAKPQAGPGLAEVPLTLTDQGGRNVVGLGAVAANVPGKSMQAADKLVEMRRGGRPGRIAESVDQNFGGGGGTRVGDDVERLQAERTKNSTPLYDVAFGNPAGFTDQMQSVLDDPITRSGLAKGLELQRLENTARRARGEPEVPVNEKEIRFDEDGTPRIVSEPNMRTLDAVKRGLDDILEGYRDKATGRLVLDQRGRAIEDVRKGWVALLDKGNPDYAAARAAWAGPSQALDALSMGQRAVTMNRDVLRRAVTGMPESNQEFLRIGAGRQIADMTSDPARAAGDARRLLEDEKITPNIDTLLTDPAQRAAFRSMLEGERRIATTDHAISPRAGSQTFRLGAGAEDMAHDPIGGAVMAMLEAGHSGGVGGMAARAGMGMYRRAQGINSTTADALASRMFSTDAAQNEATVRAMIQRRDIDQHRADQMRALLTRALQGAGTGAGIGAN
jgi:hypothetical protein